MKNTILFVILLGLPLAFIACNKDDEDIKLDFELTFPENWNSRVFAETGYVMDASRKAVNENDSFPETVVIFRTGVQSGSLDIYYAALKLQIQKTPGYDRMFYETDTTINTINFIKMVSQEHLEYIVNSNDTITVQEITERYFTINQLYGINLTFIALNRDYAEAKPVFDEIIGTFRFK